MAKLLARVIPSEADSAARKHVVSTSSRRHSGKGFRDVCCLAGEDDCVMTVKLALSLRMATPLLRLNDSVAYDKVSLILTNTGLRVTYLLFKTCPVSFLSVGQ